MAITSGGEYPQYRYEFAFKGSTFHSDRLVAAAVGDSSFGGVSYSTTAENITGLLPPGASQIDDGTYVLSGI